VISREDEDIITSVTAGHMIADHTTPLVKLHVTKPPTTRQKVTLIRKIKSSDKTKFKEDIACFGSF
jgi:hypothetical protein